MVNTPPGSCKSRDAAQLLNQAWGEVAKKGLYLMLNHQLIEERLDRLDKDGKAGL